MTWDVIAGALWLVSITVLSLLWRGMTRRVDDVELQATRIEAELASHRVQIAENYPSKAEFRQVLNDVISPVQRSLNRIEGKLFGGES